MHINPTLLLLMAAIFVFSPTIQQWITSGGTAWYRPYIVWSLVILYVYMSQRGKKPDEF
jgi:hypothetical protein